MCNIPGRNFFENVYLNRACAKLSCFFLLFIYIFMRKCADESNYLAAVLITSCVILSSKFVNAYTCVIN